MLLIPVPTADESVPYVAFLEGKGRPRSKMSSTGTLLGPVLKQGSVSVLLEGRDGLAKAIPGDSNTSASRTQEGPQEP